MFRTPRIGPERPATLLAAVAGDQADWLEALWPDPGPLFAATDARRQLWFAVGAQLALRPGRVAAVRPPGALAEWLLTSRAIEIVRGAGLGAPPGWRRALGRLGPFALARPELYLELFDVLADGGPGASILQHAAPVTEPLIGVLAALPPDLRRPALVAALLRIGARPDEEARRWTWRLGRLRVLAPEAAAAIEAAVRDGACPTDLLDVDGPGAHAALPEPPWEGTARLVPLRTAAAMIDAGRRFENCLASRIDYVRGGRGFYYEWLDDPGMIVELEIDLPYGWQLDDVRLANNRKPTREALAALAAELSGAEAVFCPEPRVRSRGRDFFASFQREDDDDGDD